MSREGEVERWLESGAPVSPGLASRWFQALYETPLMFSGILDASGCVLDANQLSIEGCGFVRAPAPVQAKHRMKSKSLDCGQFL